MKIKKIITLLAISTLAVSFSACGKEKVPGTTETVESLIGTENSDLLDTETMFVYKSTEGPSTAETITEESLAKNPSTNKESTGKDTSSTKEDSKETTKENSQSTDKKDNSTPSKTETTGSNNNSTSSESNKKDNTTTGNPTSSGNTGSTTQNSSTNTGSSNTTSNNTTTNNTGSTTTDTPATSQETPATQETPAPEPALEHFPYALDTLYENGDGTGCIYIIDEVYDDPSKHDATAYALYYDEQIRKIESVGGIDTNWEHLGEYQEGYIKKISYSPNPYLSGIE